MSARYEPLNVDCPQCRQRPRYVVTRLWSKDLPDVQCCEDCKPGSRLPAIGDKRIREVLQAVAEKSYRMHLMTSAERAYDSVKEERAADRAERKARNGR